MKVAGEDLYRVDEELSPVADMRPREGQYEGHKVMLEAANQGARPSGPLTKAFRPGKWRTVYEREQTIQM